MRILLRPLVVAVALLSPAVANAGPGAPPAGEPQVSDTAGDAARTPAGPLGVVTPSSVPGADLVSAGLTVPDGKTYVVQTTTSGPTDARFRTAVTAIFHPQGMAGVRDCDVYWFLPVGERSYANIFCDRHDGSRYFVQRLRGGVVHAQAVPSGYRLVSAFSSSDGQLGLLNQDTSVDSLGALSCGSEAGGCNEAADVYDRATSTASVELTGRALR